MAGCDPAISCRRLALFCGRGDVRIKSGHDRIDVCSAAGCYLTGR